MATLQAGRLAVFSPVVAFPRPAVSTARASSFRCRLTDDDDGAGSSGKEEPAESLFMKELKRRGMSARQRVDDRTAERLVEVEMEGSGDGERTGGGAKTNGGVASAEYEKELEGQSQRSMALNSEGLEGLIPRAKLLLSLGATFFLNFGPLILVTVGFFSALYLYFGPTFLHGASKSGSSPQYVDPYALLEDEEISQMAPPLE